MSGIDWSIFKEGEEDTFGWLLRTNTSSSELTSASLNGGNQRTSSQLLPSDALPLDDIQMDENETSLLGLDRSVGTTATSPIIIKDEESAALSRNDSMVLAEQGDESVNDDGSEPIASEIMNQMNITANKASKRPLKRKKPSPSVSTIDTTPKEDLAVHDKKQLRRVKNLASVREFRKRKTQQLEQNEARLRRLEAENMDLKMRLKIGKEALLSEQREKQQIKEQMREMLQRNATEQEIAQFLNMYKVTYSDYGPKRREKLHFHLARIRELLLPTQVTKLCLYSVEQGSDMMARDNVIKEDPMAVPDSATAPMSLWGILAKELDVSEAQQRQILERKAAIAKVRDRLNHTLNILKQLEEVTDEKNTALEAQVAELQHILTPSQATKFIIWVKENPAFMYMLDKLVDSTLMSTATTDQ